MNIRIKIFYYQLVGSLHHFEIFQRHNFKHLILQFHRKTWQLYMRSAEEKEEITFEKFMTTLFIDMEIIYGLLFFTLILLNDLQSTLLCVRQCFFS